MDKHKRKQSETRTILNENYSKLFVRIMIPIHQSTQKSYLNEILCKKEVVI